MHDGSSCPAGVDHPDPGRPTVARAASDPSDDEAPGADPWWEWFVTGVRPVAAPDADTARDHPPRLSAFADPDLLTAAMHHGWIGPGDRVLGSTGPVQPRWHEQHYGLGPRTADGAPAAGVVLRVGDEHDLSAFLRDADAALTTGRFADHFLRPDVLVADLASLGAEFTDAGPDHRVWVGPRGRISTSPAGADLGDLRDTRDVVQDRWRRRNGDGSRPCTVGLGAALDERDRTDALADRPWLPRFHGVVRALRGLRARGTYPVAVSGFGRRLDRRVAELQPGPVIDDPAAPILAVTRHQGRNRHWVLTPDGRRCRTIGMTDAVRLELLLAFRSRSGAELADRPRAHRSDLGTARSLDQLITLLVDDGICADWFAALESGARPLLPGEPVFG